MIKLEVTAALMATAMAAAGPAVGRGAGARSGNTRPDLARVLTDHLLAVGLP